MMRPSKKKVGGFGKMKMWWLGLFLLSATVHVEVAHAQLPEYCALDQTVEKCHRLPMVPDASLNESAQHFTAISELAQSPPPPQFVIAKHERFMTVPVGLLEESCSGYAVGKSYLTPTKQLSDSKLIWGLDVLARGYYLNDQRIQWSGVKKLLGLKE